MTIEAPREVEPVKPNVESLRKVMRVALHFTAGPQIPRPPSDPAKTWVDCHDERTMWADVIEDAIREHDAWGLFCTAPNCDVTLRDVLTPGSVWAATAAHSIRLLLARETTEPGQEQD